MTQNNLFDEVKKDLGDSQAIQSELSQGLGELETQMHEFEESLNAMLAIIGEVSTAKTQVAPAVPAAVPSNNAESSATPDDGQMLANIEKLLAGSLGSLEEKLSDRMKGLMKGLEGMSGSDRQRQMQHIRAAADEDDIDLSGLFTEAVEVKSNMSTKGLEIEEKESKGGGISDSLAKLRKMRGK
ncbi:MAG: hypothetical protein ACI9CF_001345 [Candidatus Omnitrophota bacterium]|jgi:hypothetical protein